MSWNTLRVCAYGGSWCDDSGLSVCVLLAGGGLHQQHVSLTPVLLGANAQDWPRKWILFQAFWAFLREAASVCVSCWWDHLCLFLFGFGLVMASTVRKFSRCFSSSFWVFCVWNSSWHVFFCFRISSSKVLCKCCTFFFLRFWKPSHYIFFSSLQNVSYATYTVNWFVSNTEFWLVLNKPMSGASSVTSV